MLDVGGSADVFGSVNNRLGKYLAAKFLLGVLSAVGHRWLLCLGLRVAGRFDLGFVKVYG